MKVILGAKQIDRKIYDAEKFLIEYRKDIGCDYLDYQPITPQDRVFPEDLAVTLAVNSRAGWKAFRSLKENSKTIDLSMFPNKSLDKTTESDRNVIANLIAEVANLPGFAASLASKLLHKKRPRLIPILDNQAIFGAYMNENWPRTQARRDSEKREGWIRRALEWIYIDVTRSENLLAWKELLKIEPTRTKIELFDSVWWMYFRKTQPVSRGIEGND